MVTHRVGCERWLSSERVLPSGGHLAVTLTDAVPGHVWVTVTHGATTVARTALLCCTWTVHLSLAIPAKDAHAGESLCATVGATENRRTGKTEEYVPVQ